MFGAKSVWGQKESLSCSYSTSFYFKATINAKVEPEGLECDSIFISY